jgi:D-tyrosyl-tRNA(Tyr) deacylase
MRIVIQRVTHASVTINEPAYKQGICEGFVILLGIRQGDTLEDVHFLADKCANLRVFEDENGKMNNSLLSINGEVLIVSQFTLYGAAQRGNRPSFSDAAKPEEAVPLYEAFIARMKENIGAQKVKTGIFGAMMQVELLNDGPVTIIIDSKDK